MDPEADEHVKAFNNRYGEQSKKFWSIYTAEAEQHDTNVTETWKADMDSMLIFAGLFSAVVTAFIIESYKLLKQDPSDVTTALLSQLLTVQITALTSPRNNSSAPLTLPSIPPITFVPTASAIAVNFLWFFSLACSLAAAFCVILVQQWVRDYLQRVQKNSQPIRRARDRAFLFNGMQKYRMDLLVENVPTLLHASLFFFFIGLCVYLFSTLDSPSVAVTGATVPPLLFCFLIYALATLAPLLDPSAPFETPFSSILWGIQQRTPTRFTRYYRGEEQNPVPASANLVVAREQLALNPLSHHDSHNRDAHALLWSYRRVNDDSELQRFIESIPGFLECEDGRTAWRVFRRRSPDSLQELELQIHFLLFETSRAGYMDSIDRKRRVDACLEAFYTISLCQQIELPSAPPLMVDNNFTLEHKHLPLAIQGAKGLSEVSKVICTASLMVRRALITELNTAPLPNNLYALSEKADRALEDVRTLQKVLEDVLRALPSSQSWDVTDVGELLQIYFALLHTKSMDILDCIRAIQNIISLVKSSHSNTLLWHSQLPLISPLVIEYLDPIPYLGASQSINLYAHQVLAFMRATGGAGLNRRPTFHSILRRHEWFPITLDMVQSQGEHNHLHRDLETISFLLDHLLEPTSELTVRPKVGRLSETYIPAHTSGTTYSITKYTPPVAPQRPFTTLSFILEDIRDNGRVVALFELLARLRQHGIVILAAPDIVSIDRQSDLDALHVVEDTINAITQPSPWNNPLVLSEGSQILLVILVRSILAWKLDMIAARRPYEPPISKISLQRLFDWFKISLTYEIPLRTAEELFGLTLCVGTTMESRTQAVWDHAQLLWAQKER